MYLSTLLWLRPHRVAFAVSKRWEESENEKKVEAALDLQRHLIDYYGYYECPHCHFATRKVEEHVTNPVHPCSIGYRDALMMGAVREGFKKLFAQLQSVMESHPVKPEPPLQSPTLH